METLPVKPPMYECHEGTVRISGKTSPRSAGFCAFVYLQKGVSPIDFFYIGGNAGQQAMKAMSVFAFIVHQESGAIVAFRPLRYMTITVDVLTGEKKEKDATVWRTIIVAETEEDSPNFTSKEPERSNEHTPKITGL